MKNFRVLTVTTLVLICTASILGSCKKGDGDPFFSIYSRKARLCGDWKIAAMKETVKFNRTTITTDYDSDSKKVETYVPDTIVYTPTDTLNEYRKMVSYHGSVNYTFDKSATYQIDEAFTNDTTGVQYASQEVGYWYFTGGGAETDTKPKELLGLQPTKYIYNPLNPNTYTITYDGQSNMRIFHIYKLASKEIVLKYTLEETENLWTVTTEGEITLRPR